MYRIHDDLAYKDFTKPSCIGAVAVCKESGKLPIEGDLAINECQKVRDLRKQLIRCESGTDSIVWMREESVFFSM